MADRPLPPRLSPAAAAALAEHRAGRISAEVALMRLMLAGLPAGEVPAAVADHPALAALARRHPGGLATLERMVREGADHGPADLAATRAMFDRLATLSPEAGVAAYSFGDPGLLAAATEEVVGWLRGLGLLEGRPRVLDLGCGIGRVAAALAAEAGYVLGLDISPAMLAEARARHGALPGLGLAAVGGRDLAAVGDARCELVLALDVFPYLVRAGEGLAAGMLAEAARVLRPGGQVVILNWSYASPAAGGPEALAPACGLHPLESGTRPLRLWDARAFRLLRPGAGSS